MTQKMNPAISNNWHGWWWHLLEKRGGISVQ